MEHKLIDLLNWPTIPAPFDSIDEGESWVWGDYVLLLQRYPKTMAEKMALIMGTEDPLRASIKYPYAMPVFYKQDKNPHGNTRRPIYVATLEIVANTELLKIFYASMGLLTEDLNSIFDRMPIMKCLFTPDQHLNFGPYSDFIDIDTVRGHFFHLLKGIVPLNDEPIKIGNISDAYGHPLTGWPNIRNLTK